MKELLLFNLQKAKVDDEDYDKLQAFPSSGWWYVDAVGYVRCHAENSTYMHIHRIIMNAQKGEYVDHIDKDKLNNQKSNLRICTNQENIFGKTKRWKTSSEFKGVSKYYHSSTSFRFRSYISKNYKQYSLGFFDDEIVAAEAYDFAAVRMFGKFAVLNFPEKLEEYKDYILKGVKPDKYKSLPVGHPKGTPTWNKGKSNL